MNVLVTGIDGFVGSHLAGELLRDPDVKLFGLVIDRAKVPLIEHFKGRIELIQADIRDRRQVDEALRACKPQRVYHLAGQAFVPTSYKDPVDTFYVNIDGGIHILDGVRIMAPDALVLVVSSGEVYGITESGKKIDEEYPLKPENPYAASKACIDLIAQQYRSTFGLNVVVARAFNHLGPGQSDVFVGSGFARQVAEAKLGLREKSISVGNLEAKRDFTDVRDVVRAYVALLGGERKHTVYNVCSGHSVAIQVILDWLISLSGVKVDVVKDPGRMRKSDNPDVVGSARRLETETGWTPSIPLERTLGDILEYWERRLKT
jgi:GDP-4-dehydro-6-deoxy-D-mannose reductase